MTCMYQMLEKNTGLGTLHLLHKWKLVPFLTVYWMQSIRISEEVPWLSLPVFALQCETLGVTFKRATSPCLVLV